MNCVSISIFFISSKLLVLYQHCLWISMCVMCVVEVQLGSLKKHDHIMWPPKKTPGFVVEFLWLSLFYYIESVSDNLILNVFYFVFQWYSRWVPHMWISILYGVSLSYMSSVVFCLFNIGCSNFVMAYVCLVYLKFNIPYILVYLNILNGPYTQFLLFQLLGSSCAFLSFFFLLARY